MPGMIRRIFRPKIVIVAVVLVVTVAGIGSLIGWWDWKTLIAWRALVDYIEPKDATGRKDAVQVYALIFAGVLAAITAVVGLANLRLTRKNLDQQRDLEVDRAREQRALEDHRAQSTALQAYYEQMGKLLTEYDLSNTKREDIRLLARAQTLSVLEGLEPTRKSRLLRFLVGSFLVQSDAEKNVPAISLWDADLSGAYLSRTFLSGAILMEADLSGADLRGANLMEADLSGADLSRANLREADLSRANLSRANLSQADLSGADLMEADLSRANLSQADLSGADLMEANLSRADLSRANLMEAEEVTAEQLSTAQSLKGATLPDGSVHD